MSKAWVREYLYDELGCVPDDRPDDEMTEEEVRAAVERQQAGWRHIGRVCVPGSDLRIYHRLVWKEVEVRP